MHEIGHYKLRDGYIRRRVLKLFTCLDNDICGILDELFLIFFSEFCRGCTGMFFKCTIKYGFRIESNLIKYFQYIFIFAVRILKNKLGFLYAITVYKVKEILVQAVVDLLGQISWRDFYFLGELGQRQRGF